MKSLLLLALLACTVGCANEGPTSEEIGDQLSRGVRGQGQLTSDIDRSNDPYVKPRGGAASLPDEQ